MIKPYISNIDRFKLAKWSIIILIISHTMKLIDIFIYHEMLLAIKAGKDVSFNEIQIQAGIYYLLIAINSPLRILGFILVGMWLRRAYVNIRVFNIPLQYQDWWAVWGWFIPIANLFKPFYIFKDLFTKTQYILDKEVSQHDIYLSVASLRTWWIIGLIGMFLDNLAVFFTNPESFIQFQINANALFMLSTILILISLFLFYRLMKCYHQAEQHLPHSSWYNNFIPNEESLKT
jgi:hypothetical protein